MSARRLTLLLAVAAATLAVGATYALADDIISSSATCCTYSSSTFTITGGQVAQFHNGTVGLYAPSHSVSANDTKTLGGKPLFASKIIGSGSSARVNGTQYLAPGDYVFHCAVHGPSMSATLHVVGGTPLARPALTLAIKSGKLAKVRKSGKLKATVADAGSDAAGIALSAKLGGKELARANGVKVTSGATDPVTMKLSKSGEKQLKGLDQAKIKLSATVAFGRPASARRTLR